MLAPVVREPDTFDVPTCPSSTSNFAFNCLARFSSAVRIARRSARIVVDCVGIILAITYAFQRPQLAFRLGGRTLGALQDECGAKRRGAVRRVPPRNGAASRPVQHDVAQIGPGFDRVGFATRRYSRRRSTCRGHEFRPPPRFGKACRGLCRRTAPCVTSVGPVQSH